MAEKDIAPELIEKVNKDFAENLSKDKKAAGLKEKLEKGNADLKDAYSYAESVGRARAKAFASEISSEVLPDGRMYYNIASRLMEDSLSTDHELVTDYTASVHKAYNEKAGIHLKEQKADLNKDRIKGFVDSLSSKESYDDVSWVLKEPVVTHARSVVDETIRKNAEFQHKAGIKATISRQADSKCCSWCSDIAGDYTYPGVPREVFQRHDNCKCTVDYEGRRLTAYEGKNGSHSFRDQGEKERIEARKRIHNEIKEIESTPFIVRKSVGAMAQRFYVETAKPIKDFSDLYIKPGTYVEGVKVIASGRGIHDIKRLVSENPLPNGELTKEDEWFKVRGRAMITDGEKDLGTREVHWYQAKNIGKIEFKFPSNSKQR